MPRLALGRACSAGSGYCVDRLGERGVLQGELLLGALLHLLLWAPAEHSHDHCPTLVTCFLRLWVQKRVKKSDQGENTHFSLVLSFCLVLSPLKCP